MPSFIPPTPEPINWRSWKSVLFRIGIPLGIAVLIGIKILTDPSVLNFDPTITDWSSWFK